MAFPSSPVNGQIYKKYIYNSTTGTWNSGVPDFSSAGVSFGSINIGIAQIYSVTGSAGASGIYEIFRIEGLNLTTSGFLTLCGTRGGFVALYQISWSTNHNGVSYGTLNILNKGNYSPIIVYADITHQGDVIISANWGAAQTYDATIIKTSGSGINFSYNGTLWTTLPNGYETRISTT